MLHSSLSLPHSFMTPTPSSERHASQDDLRGSYAVDASPVDSDSLLRGQKTVGIVHNGSLYKLQATKLGKLILTK
jgi:hemin uptake protein HemP